MKLGDIENIIEKVKFIKCNVIYIIGNLVLGSESPDINVIKKATVPFSIEGYLTLLVKDWTDLFKEFKKYGIAYEDMDITGREAIEYKGKNYVFRSSFIKDKFDIKYSHVVDVINKNNNKLLIENLRNDTNFNKVIDKDVKAEDGCMLYKKDEYRFTLYKALLGITADDNISMKIYDMYDNGISDLCRITLNNKKHKTTVDIFIRFRKLC